MILQSGSLLLLFLVPACSGACPPLVNQNLIVECSTAEFLNEGSADERVISKKVPCDESMPEDTKATLKCRPDFEPRPDQTLYCTKSGRWDKVIGECKPRTCPPLVKPNLIIKCTLTENTKAGAGKRVNTKSVPCNRRMLPDTKASVKCPAGFKPKPEQVLICLKKGSWDKFIMQCEPSKTATTEITTKRPVPVTKPPTPAPSTTKRTVPPTPATTPRCSKSRYTLVNNEKVCKNSIVFFEDFRTMSSLDENRWSYEIKIADKPDYEFTVYDSSPANIGIVNQALRIQPTVFDANFVENGEINIDGNRCTGIESDGECSQKPNSFQILPPVRSARIISTQPFQYGLIEFQAKFPMGDWIAADLRLEPEENYYGQSYESGRIRIISRGNKNLKSKEGEDVGSRTVEGAVLLGDGIDVKSKSVYFTEPSGWRDGFHTFTIIWTPDDISFMIDGRVRRNIMVNAYGTKLSDVVGFENSKNKQWNGGRMAPFDKPFLVSIGVSVGGIRDFEGFRSDSGSGKPWRDSDPKARLNFWYKRNEWQPTWKENSDFIIKYVKVTAL